jgi:hypothetical protein
MASTTKAESFVRHHKHRAFSLLTAAIFFLAWSQCGEIAGAEKQACFHDINIDLLINPENEASDLFPELGLPLRHYKMASLEWGLLLGSSFRDLNPPNFHCKNCKNRAPPIRFPT